VQSSARYVGNLRPSEAGQIECRPRRLLEPLLRRAVNCCKIFVLGLEDSPETGSPRARPPEVNRRQSSPVAAELH
jgi:hypothetical protein